tara:strand:+ start:1279 stop:1530 length:252 start_codon:yes stop_codon:yes gene_type:complete
MAISKKFAPKGDDINRVLNQIYADINEIINSVNQSQSSKERESFSGKSGDIRLAKLSNGTYELQGKTDEGWVATTMIFKEKES